MNKFCNGPKDLCREWMRQAKLHCDAVIVGRSTPELNFIGEPNPSDLSADDCKNLYLGIIDDALTNLPQRMQNRADIQKFNDDFNWLLALIIFTSLCIGIYYINTQYGDAIKNFQLLKFMEQKLNQLMRQRQPEELPQQQRQWHPELHHRHRHTERHHHRHPEVEQHQGYAEVQQRHRHSEQQHRHRQLEQQQRQWQQEQQQRQLQTEQQHQWQQEQQQRQFQTGQQQRQWQSERQRQLEQQQRQRQPEVQQRQHQSNQQQGLFQPEQYIVERETARVPARPHVTFDTESKVMQAYNQGHLRELKIKPSDIVAPDCSVMPIMRFDGLRSCMENLVAGQICQVAGHPAVSDKTLALIRVMSFMKSNMSKLRVMFIFDEPPEYNELDMNQSTSSPTRCRYVQQPMLPLQKTRSRSLPPLKLGTSTDCRSPKKSPRTVPKQKQMEKQAANVLAAGAATSSPRVLQRRRAPICMPISKRSARVESPQLSAAASHSTSQRSQLQRAKSLNRYPLRSATSTAKPDAQPKGTPTKSTRKKKN